MNEFYRLYNFKKYAYNDFISTVGYRKHGQKFYKFMTNLTSRFQEQRKEPIVFSNKQMTIDRRIAETFSKFMQTNKKELQK